MCLHCLCFIVPLVHKIQCNAKVMKMPSIVSKLKGEIFFNCTVYVQTDSCRLSPPCPFHLPFPSFCDVAKAQSYSASTVQRTLPPRVDNSVGDVILRKVERKGKTQIIPGKMPVVYLRTERTVSEIVICVSRTHHLRFECCIRTEFSVKVQPFYT
jgi:hypothetical protein